MDKLLALLKSRTVWTIVVMLITNNIEDVKTLLPAEGMSILNIALAGAAMYFRIHPSPAVEFNIKQAQEKKLEKQRRLQ